MRETKSKRRRRRKPALRVNRIFSLYVQLIGEVIRIQGLHFHYYADDLQVFSTLFSQSGVTAGRAESSESLRH